MRRAAPGGERGRVPAQGPAGRRNARVCNPGACPVVLYPLPVGVARHGEYLTARFAEYLFAFKWSVLKL